jgi:hypothetical protein
VSGREMEYVEAKWCEWKGNGIYGSEMVLVGEEKWNMRKRYGVSGREMEYLVARWCDLKRNERLMV